MYICAYAPTVSLFSVGQVCYSIYNVYYACTPPPENNTFVNQTIDKNLVTIIVIAVIVLCLICSKKKE